MPTIMPLSDLRNYNTVLENVAGNLSELKLVAAIVEGEVSVERDGWVDARTARRRLRAS